ncbi:MAG: hypothetical protein M1829_003683 [Trizodia sp. TS-e1964]|nr:MAG: hypothetical protein M1829_003683 [Trizodia sp. TS-e1964]
MPEPTSRAPAQDGEKKTETKKLTRQSQLRSLYKTMIVAKVGPDAVEFPIYQGLACRYSPYFRAACSGNFKESIDKVVVLDEDKPETFENFVIWLNSRSLGDERTKTEYLGWNDLIDLYILADKLGAQMLKNDINFKLVDSIYLKRARRTKRTKQSGSFIKTAQTPVAHTMTGDPIHQVFADITLYAMTEEGSKKVASTMPREILILIVDEMALLIRGGTRPKMKDMCARYHRHDDATPLGKECNLVEKYGLNLYGMSEQF